MGEQNQPTPGTRFPERGQLIQRILTAGETSIHYKCPNNNDALIDVVIIADSQPRQIVALIVNRKSAQAVSIERDILMPAHAGGPEQPPPGPTHNTVPRSRARRARTDPRGRGGEASQRRRSWSCGD